ncbi:MAG: metal ABC transporter substrate-binding protein [Puniceicoccales bacterium]|jgi:ABC-type Zn uptake system ZnuABC Zn-binding protein ZnuA|nr:metal ABC transporter substrate-binding protein [Puniceicoccales bacterium]
MPVRPLHALLALVHALLAFVATGAAFAAGTAGDAPPPVPRSPETPLRVVASFTIPADWVREVGGARVSAASIVPPDADPHAYQPLPADMRLLRSATLLVGVSPEMETWFAALTRRAGGGANAVLWLAPAAAKSHSAGGTGGADCCASGRDPHVWLDPLAVIPLVRALAKRLGECDPAGAAHYAENAERYAGKLRALDERSRAALAKIPRHRRVLFSRHDNLGRLAARYDLTVGGSIIRGASTEGADPPAGELAALIRRARKVGVPLFHDEPAAGALVLTVTREAALPPPVRLRTESLAPPPAPASTYLDMFAENIRAIAGALAEKP